jgi:DNA-binding CsgD family transcriptional regulator
LSLILSKEDKKAQVIKLYEEGYTYREIAKIVRISIRDISAIIREYRGEEISSPVKEKSITSKAFQLFLDKKSLIEVAIELDISPLEVEKIHDDFVRLRYTHLIPQYYHEIKLYWPNFIQYYKIVTKMRENEKSKIKIIIDNDYIISQQERRIHQLDLENRKELEFKIKVEADIQKMKEKYEFYCSQN